TDSPNVSSPNFNSDTSLPKEPIPESPTSNSDQKRVAESNRSHKKKGMDELKHELFNSLLESDSPNN
ncbi:12715_t:CDS:2, partial [Funneliformis geosporum]